MYDYLILNQLNKYAKADKSFHMPGHKGRGDFAKRFPCAHMDITELSYSDNLAAPSGVIASAESDIAEILGAERSYILTDGSSSGIFTLMYAASKRGGKIIVPRNSHQSVWNACRIFGLEPVIVQGESREGVITPPEADVIERLVVNDVDIAGMLAVSPDYYGNISPLEDYADVLRKHKRLLLADGAHGAHLAFSPDRAGYAGNFADAWVDGAHKCLPTLTQGAVLNVKNRSLIPDIEKGLHIFRTTSPSYPVMASVEYGVKFLANNPGKTEEAIVAAEKMRAEKNIAFYPSDDWAKLAVDCSAWKLSADAVAAELEKKGIYPEFSDGRYVLFYLSPMTLPTDMKTLKSALKSVRGNKKLRSAVYVARPPIPSAPRTYSFQYALKKPSEWVDLSVAAGRMCAQNAGLTPPCIPVVVTGEMITENAVRILKSGAAFGLESGKIKVVKKS